VARILKTSVYQSVVNMELSAWSGPTINDPLALSEEVTRPSLKKAQDVIVHFAAKVKLQFDDIFVSTVKAVYFTATLKARFGPLLVHV
jgi:hypothetical protein